MSTTAMRETRETSLGSLHTDRPGPADNSDPPLQRAAEQWLAPRLRGPLFVPGDTGYDRERVGFSKLVGHHPALVVGASGAADVMAAVEFAAAHDLPVGVLNTGHTATSSGQGGLLIATRRMRGVRVDPSAGVARVEAGARWADVIHESSPFGLAPLSGSSPSVGAVGYTLGGGLGLLGRAFGYAADHVRSIDIVTAHGALLQVTPDRHSDLFWALRGGKGNFGVVTSMEVDLFAVPRLYGGRLTFPATEARRVVQAYRRWVRSMPDEMGSSFALNRFPWQPGVPDAMRGRFVAQIRVAYHGSVGDGERLVRPLRGIAVPLLDTLRDMPFDEAESIHDDPVAPFAYEERTAFLRELDEDLADTLIDLAGPDSTCPFHLLELRHLGGALQRLPQVPNAVGGRDAAFHLYATGAITSPADAAFEEYADRVDTALSPWTTGQICLNFAGASQSRPEQIRLAYNPDDYQRLVALKRIYDPQNLFRLNQNIRPLPSYPADVNDPPIPTESTRSRYAIPSPSRGDYNHD